MMTIIPACVGRYKTGREYSRGSEPQVHAEADKVQIVTVVKNGSASRIPAVAVESQGREVEVGVRKMDVEIFELERQTLVQGVLPAHARRPAGSCLRRRESLKEGTTDIVLVLAIDAAGCIAARDIEQLRSGGEAGAATHRAEPVVAGGHGVGLARVDAGKLRRVLAVHRADVALQ